MSSLSGIKAVSDLFQSAMSELKGSHPHLQALPPSSMTGVLVSFNAMKVQIHRQFGRLVEANTPELFAEYQLLGV